MIGRAVGLAIGTALAAAALAVSAPEEPHDVGLVERTSTRLAQIDVTVSGPKGAIEGLTAADFKVKLGDKAVSNVVVDDLCVAQPAEHAATAAKAPSAVTSAAQAPSVEVPRAATATYLLYFDMPHLTQSGRRGSIDAARVMLPKLLAGGHRAMIVANAAELKTVAPLTTNVTQLDGALVKMINDWSTFDPYASTEQDRLAEIMRELDNPRDRSRGTDAAVTLARRYAAEEKFRQERDLRRLGMVLGRLADLDAPKVALYFADTMRQNPGAHYLSFFSADTLSETSASTVSDASSIASEAEGGALSLDRVMNQAAAFGIRFYTVEGQGISTSDSFTQAAVKSRGSTEILPPPSFNTQRTTDAQGTLVALASETGGRPFLNGVAPSRMTAQILGDMSCVYLLSFDPKSFRQDTPLVVSVAVTRPQVKVSVRGRLVIQSDSARMTGRVLSAFAAPSARANEGTVHVGVIPISYKDGKFRARVQITVPGSAVPGATWDIGASLVSQGVVRQDGSGRIQVALPNTPIVYEKDMDFAPGDYELVAVAHEVETDTLASREFHGSWPKLEAGPASLGPISVSQQRQGGFLRNGAKQTKGAVVVAEDQVLQANAPAAVISFVCRAKDQKRPLRVVRTLIGESETPVGTAELDLSVDRCAQVVDLIPAKTLGAGTYRFVVAVSSDGNELARAERKLVVPEKAPASVSDAS